MTCGLWLPRTQLVLDQVPVPVLVAHTKGHVRIHVRRSALGQLLERDPTIVVGVEALEVARAARSVRGVVFARYRRGRRQRGRGAFELGRTRVAGTTGAAERDQDDRFRAGVEAEHHAAPGEQAACLAPLSGRA